MITEQTAPAAIGAASISVEKWNELSMQMVELQTQLAFQEDALLALDHVITSQQQSIDRLLQFQQRLERQIAEMNEGADQPLTDERPPHY